MKVKDTRLILSVDTPFFAQWANGPENKQSLRNLIGYYTELPAGFRLEIRAERPESGEIYLTLRVQIQEKRGQKVTIQPGGL